MNTTLTLDPVANENEGLWVKLFYLSQLKIASDWVSNDPVLVPN